MFETISFKNGIVTFCDDGDYLKEDLLQVNYPEDITLDVGWYRGTNKSFIIYVIKSKYKMLTTLQDVINKISV